jgi:hypothetical protein
MSDVFEFFDNPLGRKRWFHRSNSSSFSMTIREIDIMPLLMELIWDFHGFV